MAKKIVLQNDIDQQCRKFFQLSFNFQFLSRDISRCLSSVSDAFRRSGGQSTIIKTCKMQARCLSDLTRTLADGSELLRIAKETMQNLDAVIRQEVNNADMPTVYGLSYGDATSDAVVLSAAVTGDSVNGENYYVTDYKGFIFCQNDPNINRDGYMNVDGISQGCTITCMAMLLSIMTGQYHDPTEFASAYNESNPSCSDVNAVWDRAVDMSGFQDPGDVYATAYDQIINGKPSIIYANRSYGPHAVLVVGVREGADPCNLSSSDFLVVDPWDGATKSLSDVGYNGNYRIGTYNGAT